MKNIFYSALLASALVMAGCSSDNEFEKPQNITKNDVLVAEIQSGTRTTIENNRNVNWESEDKLSVFSINEGTYHNNMYELTNGANTGSATFEGTFTGQEKKVAFYPYDGNATCDATNITYTLPAIYQHNGQSIKAPMLGILNNNGNGISFKNLCSLLIVTVINIPVGMEQLTLTSGGDSALNIAGTATINYSDPFPSLTVNSNNDSKTITVNFTKITAANTSKTFYIPIPAATYPRLTLDVSSGTTHKVIKDMPNFIIASNTPYVTTVTFDKITGEIPNVVETVTNVKDELSNGAEIVEVTNVKSEESKPTIELPKVAHAEETKKNQITILLADVSTTNSIAIKEEENSTTEEATVAKSVRVAIPKQTTQQTSLDVTLPNSTVTLGAIETNASYNEVTATTADETLIVEAGVTVTELTIKGGSVKIYGTVTTLTINENSNTSKVLVYPGGSCESFTDSRNESKITLTYVPGDSDATEDYITGDSGTWD